MLRIAALLVCLAPALGAFAQTPTLTKTRTPTPVPTGTLHIYSVLLKADEGLMFWHYKSLAGKMLHEGMTVKPRKAGEKDSTFRARLESLTLTHVKAHKAERDLAKPVATKVIQP